MRAITLLDSRRAISDSTVIAEDRVVDISALELLDREDLLKVVAQLAEGSSEEAVRCIAVSATAATEEGSR